jgi:hypothetical protein
MDAEGREDPVVDPEPGPDFSRNERIALVLRNRLFLSACQIAKKVMSSKSIVHGDLRAGTGWQLNHVRRVPHNLTETEKAMRVEKTKELLALFQQVRRICQFIVTIDES